MTMRKHLKSTLEYEKVFDLLVINISKDFKCKKLLGVFQEGWIEGMLQREVL